MFLFFNSNVYINSMKSDLYEREWENVWRFQTAVKYSNELFNEFVVEWVAVAAMQFTVKCGRFFFLLFFLF